MASDSDAREDDRRRLAESRATLREARDALRAGRLNAAFRLFTEAHDLGDDNVLCHIRGHWGRARVELRAGKARDALLDIFFCFAAVLVSPFRRLRAVRGRGFGRESDL